jgi:hypothetical protein
MPWSFMLVSWPFTPYANVLPGLTFLVPAANYHQTNKQRIPRVDQGLHAVRLSLRLLAKRASEEKVNSVIRGEAQSSENLRLVSGLLSKGSRNVRKVGHGGIEHRCQVGRTARTVDSDG